MSASVKRKRPRHAGVRPGKKPGTWYIDYLDWKGIRHQKTFTGSEADAAKVRREILVMQDKIRNGLQAPPEPKAKIITLYQLWESFEADRRLKIDSGSMSESSLTRVRYTYKALLKYDKDLKARQLGEIGAADFEAFKIYRQERGSKPGGINGKIKDLKTLFNFAVEHEIIDKSPLKRVSRVKEPKKDVRYLNEDEMRSLYFAIDQINPDDSYMCDARDLTHFLLFTGCRVSESLYPDFTWANNGQDALHFNQTKVSRARSIPKGERVKEILERRKHIEGGPFHFNPDKVYNRVTALMRQGNIEGASPQTLRRTAGSLYYLATRDIFATSRFLGHSSVIITQEHYAGLIQSLQIENYRAFEEVIKPDSLYIRYFAGNDGQSPVIGPEMEGPPSRRKHLLPPLVTRVGFEPTANGLKGHCSTS